MSKGKIHYRRAFNSPYLSSADIVERTVLTVTKVVYELDQTKRTKDHFNVIYFVEKVLPTGEPTKPMILNSGNNEIIRVFAGGEKYLDDWKMGFKITLYVDSNVRFGRDTVEGLRISPEKPKEKAELKKDTDAWTRAVASYKTNNSFDLIEKHMTISDENKAAIQEEAKNVS